MEAKEGLLGGTATGGVDGSGVGGAYGGGGGEATGGGGGGGGAASCCCRSD